MEQINPHIIKFHVIKSVLFSIVIYLLLVSLLSNLPKSIQEEGILKNTFDFSNWIESKAKLSSSQMQESNLALNFLGNIRKLSFSEASAFQNSGLIHLLAISGGQVVPLANGISNILSLALYYLFLKKIDPYLLKKYIYHSKIYLSLFISIFICSLFGWTGALVRVSALSYLQSLNFIQNQYSVFFKYTPFLISKTFYKIFVLIFISISFGNIFINYSFLLSAIGAIILELSGHITNFFILKSNFFKTISNTILTSFFTGIILYPYTNIDIINSCSANILALPIVCFLITPLSLLSMFISDQFFLYKYILKSLDYSLLFLKKIAYTFNDSNIRNNPFDKNNSLFSLEGLIYLNSILIFLWILGDFIKERKLFIARNKYLSLKH